MKKKDTNRDVQLRIEDLNDPNELRIEVFSDVAGAVARMYELSAELTGWGDYELEVVEVHAQCSVVAPLGTLEEGLAS